MHGRLLLAGVLLGLSLVGMLFAAADDDTGQARWLLVASGIAFALGLALVAAAPQRMRQRRKA